MRGGRCRIGRFPPWCGSIRARRPPSMPPTRCDRNGRDRGRVDDCRHRQGAGGPWNGNPAAGPRAARRLSRACWPALGAGRAVAAGRSDAAGPCPCPEAKRSEIGARLLGHVQRETGATCRVAVGTLALGELGGAVVRRGEPCADRCRARRTSPGAGTARRIIVLDRGMIEQASEPAVVAGHVLAAIAERTSPDALAPVIEGAGFVATLRLLTTGDVPAGALEAHAAAIVARNPCCRRSRRRWRSLVGPACPSHPWADAVDPDGAVSAPLRAADPLAGRAGVPRAVGRLLDQPAGDLPDLRRGRLPCPNGISGRRASP